MAERPRHGVGGRRTEGDARTLAAAHGIGRRVRRSSSSSRRARRSSSTPAPPGRWRFRHELVRDAVYASLSDTARAQHARRGAGGARRRPGRPRRRSLARHALAAQPLFDADRAVALAARAGESAFDAARLRGGGRLVPARAGGSRRRTIGPRWRAELLVLLRRGAPPHRRASTHARPCLRGGRRADRRPGAAGPRRARLRRPWRRPRHRVPDRRPP